MTANPPKINNQLLKNDFESLLGDDWLKLHPDIQQRFSSAHCLQTTIYKGFMHKVAMSWLGYFFAYICRLLGTPLSYRAGVMVPTEVRVYPDSKRGGTTWDRFYCFAGNKINRVRSTKVILPDCGLIEVAVSGFGMYSKVSVNREAIVFESQGYFFILGQKKISLPRFLTPGKIVASQRALNHGRFEFSLFLLHPLFGTIMQQVGIFREVQ